MKMVNHGDCVFVVMWRLTWQQIFLFLSSPNFQQNAGVVDKGKRSQCHGHLHVIIQCFTFQYF